MTMASRVLLVLAVALVAAAGSCSASWELNIRMPTSASQRLHAAMEDGAVHVAPLIHALRPLLGSGGEMGSLGGVACDSWLLGVEAHNVRGWKTIPAKCEGYVGHYMLGSRFRRDSKVVIDEAIAYAEGLKLAGNGKDVWVFDIDETTLSNLPYYATHGFGYAIHSDSIRALAIFYVRKRHKSITPYMRSRKTKHFKRYKNEPMHINLSRD